MIRNVNIFVFGEKGSGKSSLIGRISDGERSSCRKTEVLKTSTYTIKIYKDSANNLELHALYWDTIPLDLYDENINDTSNPEDNFYKRADIALLCISVDNLNCLKNLFKWKNFILARARQGCEVYAILTKIDIVTWEYSLDELEAELNLGNFGELHYTSSENGRGIDDVEALIMEHFTKSEEESKLKSISRFSILSKNKEMKQQSNSKTCCK